MQDDLKMIPKIIEQNGNSYYVSTLKRDGTKTIDEKIEGMSGGVQEIIRAKIGVWNPTSKMNKDVFIESAVRGLAISYCLKRNCNYALIQNISIPQQYASLLPRSKNQSGFNKLCELKENPDGSVAQITLKLFY
jgi:hypothetical protein